MWEYAILPKFQHRSYTNITRRFNLKGHELANLGVNLTPGDVKLW